LISCFAVRYVGSGVCELITNTEESS
jgi:hypothetical protein